MDEHSRSGRPGVRRRPGAGAIALAVAVGVGLAGAAEAHLCRGQPGLPFCSVEVRPPVAGRGPVPETGTDGAPQADLAVEAILYSMRQLRSDQAKADVLTALMDKDALSVVQIVREIGALRSPSLQGHFFRRLVEQDLTREDATVVLRGTRLLRSSRARREIILGLVGRADPAELLLAAQALPDLALQRVLLELL